MKVGDNALGEFLDSLIVWEAEIVAILRTNQAMKRLSARQQEEYDNATRCYICRHKFVKGKAKGPKVRDTTTSRAGLSSQRTASVTWSAQSVSRSQYSSTTFVATMLI